MEAVYCPVDHTASAGDALALFNFQYIFYLFI